MRIDVGRDLEGDIGVSNRASRKGLWILCGMRMLSTGVDLEFLHLMASEARLGGHAPNCLTNDFFGIACEHLSCGRGL